MSKPSRGIIHAFALAGGTIAGATPPILDIPALSAEEIVMVIKLGKEFGVDIDKTAAAGVLTAAGCTVAGTAVFEAVNIGYPLTIPVKIAVATATIEAAGNLVYNYFEKKYG